MQEADTEVMWFGSKKVVYKPVRRWSVLSPSELKKPEKIKKIPVWSYEPLHGTTVGNYSSVHSWLKKNYGKATRCENVECLHLCEVYEWSKLKGKEYKKVRSSFRMLCRTCHRRYDNSRTTILLIC